MAARQKEITQLTQVLKLSDFLLLLFRFNFNLTYDVHVIPFAFGMFFIRTLIQKKIKLIKEPGSGINCLL